MQNPINVIGTALQPCGTRLKTGFYRDGRCNTDEDDRGLHTVCAVVDEPFLLFSRERGNDLMTPVPQFDFPGLKPGDRWCLCATRWKEAWEHDEAPPVILEATHQRTLDIISLETLLEYATEMPGNA